jgi:2-polyprenyl-3-methyl-5-hydroxy-6-metoxy-1,4-benzoquinol methylase
MDKEKDILRSWEVNAVNWADLIQRNGIESRRVATNKAIIDAVSAHHPNSVLDVGCGEGWLVKELNDRGMTVIGFDAIPELINKARQKSKSEFIVASYEDIYSGKIKFTQQFDAIVANFSLIGKESTENLLHSLRKYLSADGALFIQTLHPFVRKEINDYESGWKEGSWDGFDQFVLPYQWYFRTLEDWILIIKKAGFKTIDAKEICHPDSLKLLSVIFRCQ